MYIPSFANVAFFIFLRRFLIFSIIFFFNLKLVIENKSECIKYSIIGVCTIITKIRVGFLKLKKVREMSARMRIEV